MKYATINNDEIEIAESEEEYYLSKYPDLKMSEAKPEPNWSRVLEQVRGTQLFGKVWTVSQTNPAVNTTFTLLVATLMSREPNTNDLRFSLENLKTKLFPMVLTQSDLTEINQVLKNNNFEFQI